MGVAWQAEEIEEFLVDSGCSKTLVDAGKKLTGAVKSDSFVQGFDKTQRKKMRQDGTLLVQFFDANDDAGAVAELPVSTIDNLAFNLLSVQDMVQRLGYELRLRNDGGFSGFIKRNSRGEVLERLPVLFDKRRRVYTMKYQVATQFAHLAANFCVETSVPTFSLSAIVSWVIAQGGEVQRQHDLIAAPGVVIESDVVSTMCEKTPNLASGGGLGAEYDEIFAEFEVSVTSTERPGEKKLTAKERHEKYGHIGHLDGCLLCQQLRKQKRVYRGISRGFDLVEGRTWHIDILTVSVRSWRGNKYIIGGRDECTGYMFAIYIERRSDAVDALIEFIKEMRRDPELRNPEIFGRIWLDPAGEWHTRNVSARKQLEEVGIEVILRDTSVDKRQNALAEATMGVIGTRMRKQLLATTLPVEYWEEACTHGIKLSNLLCAKKMAGPDGDGPRPIERLSRNNVTRRECDRRLWHVVPPGSIALVDIPNVKGSDVKTATRVRWGWGMGNEGSIGVFQCPFNLKDKRHVFRSKHFSLIKTPDGVSGLEFLGLHAGALPKSCLPRKGDSEANRGKAVIKMDGLGGGEAKVVMSNPVRGVTVHGDSITPKVAVVNEAGRLFEPDSKNGALTPTSTFVRMIQSSQTPEATVPIIKDERRDRLLQYRSVLPSHFVGMPVWRDFGRHGVFKGTITGYDDEKDNEGRYVWRVHYSQDDKEEWIDEEELQRCAIDFVYGKADTGEGRQRDKQLTEELEFDRNVTFRRKDPVDAVDSGDVDDDGLQNDAADGDQHGDIEEELLYENISKSLDVEWYVTRENDTWSVLMAEFDLDNEDNQKTYWDWIRKYFKRGNVGEFRKDPKAVHFPCPFRRKTKGQKELSFDSDTHFPYPRGRYWDAYLHRKAQAPDPGDVAAMAMRFEKEYYDLNHMYVVFDHEELKASIGEEDPIEFLEKQIRLSTDADFAPGKDEICWAAVEESNLVDANGIPVPPKNMVEARKRPDRQMWEDARLKEEKSLHDLGVFEYLTYEELKTLGIVPRKRIVPMRMLLTAKMKSDGSFDRAKCRNIVQGHKGYLQKGVHYAATVFAPTPSLAENRLIQALAVGDNYVRFAFDIETAFLHADFESEEERLPVRFAEGCRKFNKDGKELFGLLRRNLYGTPMAPKNWTRCRNDFILNEMGKDEGWQVSQMVYAPCMFKVVIDGLTSYLVIHTDDIDGITKDPKHAERIMLKFKKKFGIKVVSPTDMLGLERHVYVKDGVRYCHLSQKAYVDRLWAEFGHHRRTTRVPERPCGDILFTTKETGKAVEVDKEESDAVIQKGYRELVGGLLWPARNTAPSIQHAVSQLCKCMQSPSLNAWSSALQVLHWLYANREEGITFRSDGNSVLRCFSDSGHFQSRTTGGLAAGYKNTWGCCIHLFNGPILWMSKRHSHSGLSAAEDEYMALCHAGRQVVWLRHLLTEMGQEQHVGPDPTVIECDNKQALGWSTEQMVTNGNRFIERDYHKVKEWVEMGYLDPRHVKGIENPSDLFTKSVDAPTQRHLGPMISGKVLLNPVSLPLNALTKKEPKVAYKRKSKM